MDPSSGILVDCDFAMKYLDNEKNGCIRLDYDGPYKPTLILNQSRPRQNGLLGSFQGEEDRGYFLNRTMLEEKSKTITRRWAADLGKRRSRPINGHYGRSICGL